MRASRSIWYRWAVGSSKVSLSRGIAFWGQDFEQVATVPASLLALGFDIHSGAAFLFMQAQCQTEHHRQVGVAPSSPASVEAGGWRNPSGRLAPLPPTSSPSSASPLSRPAFGARGFETAEPAADRARFDVALVEAPFTTVVRSKTDVEAAGAVVTITPAAMQALDAIGPAGVGGEVQVFGLSESQIARRVKAIARAAGLADWEFFSGHSGRVGMARRMAQNGAPTHEIERQGRWKQGGGMVGRYTRGETAGSALRYL